MTISYEYKICNLKINGKQSPAIDATDTGDPVPTEWQTYRQALRDIPEQTGFPEEIEWPQEPEA